MQRKMSLDMERSGVSVGRREWGRGYGFYSEDIYVSTCGTNGSRGKRPLTLRHRFKRVIV